MEGRSRQGLRGRGGILLLVLSALLLLAGCASSSPANPLAAASVNGHGISLDDYEQLLAYAEAVNASGGPYGWQSPGGRGNSVTWQTQVLSFLEHVELMREALADQHASLSDKELQTALKQFNDNLNAGKNSTDPTTRAAVAAELPYLTGRVRYLIAEQTALENKLINTISLWTVHLRAITASSKSQAEQLLSQLQQGADFGKLANQTNTDQSSGGEVGTEWYGSLPAVFTMPAFGKNPDKDTPPKYSIVPYTGRYFLIEVTNKAKQKLSTVPDAQSRSTIFTNWLQFVYFNPAMQNHRIEQYIYIPPAATQQSAAQG
jgi:hypothetical protein